ncbi:MAG: hypothetical protein QNJ26_20160, partial [Desulfobacterales bacterium]|nr:hypothetical protein [Desulfobacterales bacterium]
MLGINLRQNSRLIALSLIIAYLVFFSACRNDSPRQIAPKVVNGTLDLSDWDLSADGPLNLVGEYEFYWNQHLSPSDF